MYMYGATICLSTWSFTDKTGLHAWQARMTCQARSTSTWYAIHSYLGAALQKLPRARAAIQRHILAVVLQFGAEFVEEIVGFVTDNMADERRHFWWHNFGLCVCACVWEREGESMCLCMCVWERESERARESEREHARKRERKRHRYRRNIPECYVSSNKSSNVYKLDMHVQIHINTHTHTHTQG